MLNFNLILNGWNLNFKILRSNVSVDCYSEYSKRVYAKKDQNCRISVLKCSLPWGPILAKISIFVLKLEFEISKFL